MNTLESFQLDASKTYLGSLCKRSHDWNGTGKSLRYLSKKDCVQCVWERSHKCVSPSRPKSYKREDDICVDRSHILGRDLDRYRVLPSLCVNRHNWEGTGKSLGHKGSRSCLFCNLDSKRQKREDYRRKNPKPQTLINLSDSLMLGGLCFRSHDWEGTELSLRYRSCRKCVECRKIETQSPKVKQQKAASHMKKVLSGEAAARRKQTQEKRRLNALTEKYCLGTLCRRGHEYKNTGKTLRFISNNGCTRCFALQSRTENAKKSRSRRYNRLKQHPSFIGKRKAWLQTPKGMLKKKADSIKRQARKKNARQVKYTPEELNERLKFFDSKCVYCLSKENLSVDHFLPISRGGSDCLGNFVPACLTCNKSKNASDPFEWFEKQPFYSERRWNRLMKKLGLKNTHLQYALF